MANNNERRSNKDIYERIAIVETQIESLCNELIRIRTNDLAHIEKAIEKNSDKIDSLERKVAIGVGILGTLQFLIPFITDFIK